MIRNISGNLHIIRKLRHFLFEKTKNPKKRFVSKLNDIRLMNNHLILTGHQQLAHHQLLYFPLMNMMRGPQL